ncbi:FUSC family protein [Streptomyces sp. MUM 2J]|uniref:FUSC family protein n=1 Tax=Streptomyces sp. MUM 2J TaxID=2791987 RepID=UPI001F04823B|nr:FUSC family protein [Streptomyces sp. MUM 2J]MCH0562732.1 FUSC family protein [Streptomyces sp. MUM 2J]
MSRPRATLTPPPWLAHALRAQRVPVPWSAVTRGALAAGPLLSAALLTGRASLGVVAAVAAMLAGINDRPGSRRAAVGRIGGPALAGAVGLCAGTYAGQNCSAVVLTLLLTGLGLIAGCASAGGPVASAAGTQVLVAAAIGAGMPLPETGWQRGLAFLAGAGWLLLLRLALPTPGSLAGGDFRFDGERVAVARVYDAVGDLLDAAGTAQAGARRAALTAALDQAQDALAGPRLRRCASSAAERRLHAQYAAALPLAEAATALAWAGESAGPRASVGPRRLAAAVRDRAHTRPLPAPDRSVPALRALDDALLHAAEAFDRGYSGRALHRRRRTVRQTLTAAFGRGGREYGMRVALCFGAGSAAAQALHHARWYGSHPHWYWLPVTAVFLVKPDLGPLVSRVLCRAAGTVLGALVFAGLAALLPRPEGLVAVVAVCGALLPAATRHFAAQTAVATVLVLALVMVGGEPQASAGRIGETLLACVIVLVVGHLPMPARRGGGVRHLLAAAASAAYAHLGHVLAGSEDRAARWTLRREAYRSLAEARTAIALAAAELPPVARHTEGADAVAGLLERLVDTTTACAVHLDDTGRLTSVHLRRLHEVLGRLDRMRERVGLPDPGVPRPERLEVGSPSPCRPSSGPGGPWPSPAQKAPRWAARSPIRSHTGA